MRFVLSERSELTAARRFFVEGSGEPGHTVAIDASDAHRITRVLRLQHNDHIEIVDSTARSFIARIEDVGAIVHATLVEALDQEPLPGKPLAIAVAQAVPKGRRMDLVVEKCTELGASAFLPFYCERSVSRDVGSEKLARWQRLARTAAQQSGRRDVPRVAAPVTFDAIVACFGEYDAVLFAWETAPRAPVWERLRSTLPETGVVLVIVGPEGGFTHAEAELAQHSGAAWVSLGARILRTDTAAIVLLAVIGALTS